MESAQETNQILLERALENIPLKERSDIPEGKMGDHLAGLVEKFMEEKVKDFGRICLETRKDNYIQLKHYASHGYKGKYTGSDGWSKDGSMQFKWTIPVQLKFFMRNCVYIDFWEDENSKVRDNFMKRLLRGDDPYQLLQETVAHYGRNPNKVITEKDLV